MTRNTKLRLGPFRFNVTGLSVGAAVALFIVFMIIALAVAALVVGLLVHNLWIVYTGHATGWNFLFIVLLAWALLSNNTNDDKN